MKISVSEAKAQLTDLVRRAERGEEVILTRHGQPAARLLPMEAHPNRAHRRAVLEKVIAAARVRGPDGGPDAAHAADFLYGEDGLPA